MPPESLTSHMQGSQLALPTAARRTDSASLAVMLRGNVSSAALSPTSATGSPHASPVTSVVVVTGTVVSVAQSVTVVVVGSQGSRASST